MVDSCVNFNSNSVAWDVTQSLKATILKLLCTIFIAYIYSIQGFLSTPVPQTYLTLPVPIFICAWGCHYLLKNACLIKDIPLLNNSSKFIGLFFIFRGNKMFKWAYNLCSIAYKDYPCLDLTLHIVCLVFICCTLNRNMGVYFWETLW